MKSESASPVRLPQHNEIFLSHRTVKPKGTDREATVQAGNQARGGFDLDESQIFG